MFRFWEPWSTAEGHITSAVLQGSQANVAINVHKSPVRRNLNDTGFHGRMPSKKKLLTKMQKQVRLSYVNAHVNKLDRRFLLLDATKVVLFGGTIGGLLIQRLKRRILYQQLNMDVKALWFGSVCCS